MRAAPWISAGLLLACASEPRTGPQGGVSLAAMTFAGSSVIVHDVPIDVDLGDPRVIDAVLAHALNGGCVDSRHSYAGRDPSRIAYKADEFPEGFVPDVEGIDFTSYTIELVEEPYPRVEFRGLDGSYLVVNYTVLTGKRLWNGERYDLNVGFSNHGGVVREGVETMLIGGCSNFYDADRTGDELRLTYVGSFDP